MHEHFEIFEREDPIEAAVAWAFDASSLANEVEGFAGQARRVEQFLLGKAVGVFVGQFVLRLESSHDGLSKLSLRRGLDDGGHGTFATGDEFIFAVGVNLIALEFGEFFVDGGADDATFGVDGFGKFESALRVAREQVLGHPHDVLVGVVAVVEQDDVPHLQRLGFARLGCGLSYTLTCSLNSGRRRGWGCGVGLFHDCAFRLIV